MPKTPKEYLAELEKDMEGGINNALAKTASEGLSEQGDTKKEKERVLKLVKRVVIALLEEGKIDPKMTLAEFPAFLDDEMKRPD